MNKIPKNCLTCKFMDFADDELEDLRCYHPLNMPNSVDGLQVNDDGYCQLYKLNKAVKEDAKQGCW